MSLSKGVTTKFDRRKQTCKSIKSLETISRDSKSFLKSFGGMKPKKAFEISTINCTMIVVIKLYSSIILLTPKSLKLMMKKPRLLWLLPGCR